MRIDEIDVNFQSKPLEEDGMLFYDVKKGGPFHVYGLKVFETDGLFERVPNEIAATISPQMEDLSRHTSGGRVRFRTNSFSLGVKYRGTPAVMPHATPLMVGGFDVYCGKTFVSSVMPQPVFGGEYSCRVPLLQDGKLHDYTVNFPLYGGVQELVLGIEKGAKVRPAKPYSMEKPVVFYGHSITQGGCASRAGTCYQAYISRELNCDFYNFGFSGNAKGDLEIARYIAKIDAALFLYEYDGNAPDADFLQRTHEPFYKLYRELCPDTPVLFTSRTWRMRETEEGERRNQIVRTTFEHALARGEKVGFVDGSTVYPPAIAAQCTVDGVHPNDLGFYCMAKKYLPAIRKLLKK